MSAPGLVSGQIVGGKYTIRRERARTALSATYEAITAPNRDVELKIFDPAMRQWPDLEARMTRVMHATNELPQSVALHVLEVGIDHDSGAPFVATELSINPSLAELVQLCPLALEEVVVFTRNLATALDAAHGRGLAHLALCPENVFVGPSPRYEVRLVDFDANSIAGAESRDLRWAAPEIPTAPQLASDIFSAGLLTLFAATGAVLHDRSEAALRAPATALARETGMPVDPRFDAPIARALALDPAQRYPGAPDLADAVAHAFGVGPAAPAVAPPPVSVPPPPAALFAPSPSFAPPAVAPHAVAAPVLLPPPAAAVDPLAALPPAHEAPEAVTAPLVFTPHAPHARAPLPTMPFSFPPAAPPPAHALTPAYEAVAAEPRADYGGAPRYTEAAAAAARPAPPFGAFGGAPDASGANAMAPQAAPAKRRVVMMIIAAVAVVAVGAVGVVGWSVVKRSPRSTAPTASTEPVVATSAAAAPSAATSASASASAAETSAPEPPASATPSASAAESASAAPSSSAAPDEPRPAQLTVSCTPECDAVTIDGEAASSFPMSVAAGSHTVVGKRGAHPAQTKRVNLTAGKEETVSILFLASKPAAPAGAKKNCGKFLKRCD